MKKIVFLSFLLIFLIPFGHAFANDTDLYILTQLALQVPPDALILLDLSGSMAYTPADSADNAVYYDPGTCTSWQYSCGSDVAYYSSNASPNTSSCTSSAIHYTTSSSTCSAGPWYKQSTTHNHSCSGVPSTLWYNPGTCNTYTHNCGDNNIPYYPASSGTITSSCNTISSTTTLWGDPTCAGPFYLTQNYTGTSASQTNCTQSKIAIAKRALFKLLDVDNGTSTGTPDGIIDSNDQAYLKIRMAYMRYYGCGLTSQSCSHGQSAPIVPETVSSTSYQGPANPSRGNCNTLIDPINTAYSTIYCNSTSCTPSSSGSGTSIANETASGATPIGPALQEAGYYFAYTQSQDTDSACRQKFVILITDGDDTMSCVGKCGTVYQNGSEQNQYQYMGRRETVAQARALANAGYYVFVIGFGSAMPTYQKNTLNWAAYYGNPKSSSLDTGQTKSITTMYTIPFGQIYPSGILQCQTAALASTCNNGEPKDSNTGNNSCAASNDPGEDNILGYAFIAQNESQLNAAISSIRNFIINLIAQSTSYVAPVVPISQYQSTSSENSMYLGMFEPTTTTMWNGNIKKYGIASTATPTIAIGTMLDKTGQPALEPNSSTIKPTAESYWSTSADGGQVEAGGVGALILASNLNARNIYTYVGSNTDLTIASNQFITSNTANITPALLGVSTTTAVQNIINFVHGYDVWSWDNGPGNARNWILGAFIHSRPVVIHYGTQDVIYAGSNDGMLHAFDNATGNELWAFIPPDLLPNLNNFSNSLTSLQIFVDGSPQARVTYVYNSDGSIKSVSQATLMFGERRGGNTYTALDVTNQLDPKFLWSISPTQIRYGTTTTASTTYGEMGQSWSTPILGQIKNGSGTKWVAFIGGGYDATHEDATPAGTDASGRAIYVVDITNGNKIWSYSHGNDTNMKYSIPSDITPIDTNGDGLIERLYVGDVGGQMWRFDIGDMSQTGSWTGKRIFIASSTGIAGTGKSGKIFYRPDVTFEFNTVNRTTYDMLFFGTGDREKPNDTPSTDANWVNSRLYAIKDYNISPPVPLPFYESSLTDVTSDVLQSSSATQTAKTNVLNSLQSGMGWYIQLNQSTGESPNPGEKCDGAAVVLGGAVYYTTFTPTPVNTQSVCTIGTGLGNVYILQYQTGNAMFDLNDDGTISASDRSLGIGAGIPSGIVITVLGGMATGFGGVAGGVFSPPLTIKTSIVPLDWRIVF